MSQMQRAYDVAIGRVCVVCGASAWGRCHTCWRGICRAHGEPKQIILGVKVSGNLCPECAAKAAKQ